MLSIDHSVFGGKDNFDAWEIRQDAQEMLDRFYSNNKCNCLMLEITTTDDDIINCVISKYNGRYVLNR